MEDSKSGGDAGGGGNGRLLVDESSSDFENDRQRFEIELKPGETTIVSWAKLLKYSGIPVDQSPTPSPERPKRFRQEVESRSECSNIVLKKVEGEQNYRAPTAEHCRPKKQRIAVFETLEGNNGVQANKNTKMGHARVKLTADQNSNNKKQTRLSASVTSSVIDPFDISINSRSPCGLTSDRAVICAEPQSMILTSHSEEHPLNNGRMKLPDLNVPYTVQTSSTLPAHIKDESGGMMNGSLLESAILEMETIVAEPGLLHCDVQDADHSVAAKSRLPRELKQKLETVARLAHSSQGRISNELIMRLMSILGHWLKPRTLKRCLRDMVPADLSACGGDPVRFHLIEKEVVEMIKLRNPSVETKDGSTYETMELPAAHRVKYSMDHEMEDKICDFYDIYVQGMDEIKSSEIRKFYVQLAALWPKGTMDNHGIRNAICRAKERRKLLLQEKGHAKGKRRNLSTAGMDKNLHGEANLVSEQKKSVYDINAPALTYLDTVIPGTPELDQNLSAPAKRFRPPSAGSCQDLLKQGKLDVLNVAP